MSTPSPTDLQYFLEVASSGKLSRAAERLGISQPSLSAAMQRLERSIGASLLHRSSHGVVLTRAGKELQIQAQDLLDHWDRILLRTIAAHNEVSGRYTIGCHSLVALYTLPLLLPKLVRQFPKLEISLNHGLSRHVVEDVVSRRVDLGIVVNPVEHPDLVIRRILDDEVTLWYSERHGFDAQDTIIYHPDLLQTRELMQMLERGKDQRFSRHLTAPNLEVIASLVEAGVGVGILPALVATRVPDQNLIRLAKAPLVHDKVCVIYRVEQKGVQAIQAIVQASIEVMTEARTAGPKRSGRARS